MYIYSENSDVDYLPVYKDFCCYIGDKTFVGF